MMNKAESKGQFANLVEPMLDGPQPDDLVPPPQEPIDVEGNVRFCSLSNLSSRNFSGCNDYAVV